VARTGAIVELVDRGGAWIEVKFQRNRKHVLTIAALYGKIIRGTSWQHLHFAKLEFGSVLPGVATAHGSSSLSGLVVLRLRVRILSLISQLACGLFNDQLLNPGRGGLG
jgi:hypothetical protein